METITSKAQEYDDYDSEGILETFETYAMVRQKMKEKKVSRGYRPTIYDFSLAVDRYNERKGGGFEGQDEVSPLQTHWALEERVSIEEKWKDFIHRRVQQGGGLCG